MFTEYQALCEKKLFKIGQLWLYKTPNKWILNFPTKEHWRNPSKIEYVEAGLKKFAATYSEKGITSIAFPQLGCGNGELDWDTDVRPLMEHYLGSLPINVYIYIFHQELVPEHKNPDDLEMWLHHEPNYLPFEEFWTDLKKLVTTQHTFFDSNNNLLRASIEDNNLIVSSDIDQMIIEESNLLELWQTARSIGYIFPQDLSYLTGSNQNHLISLFKTLPYLRGMKFIGHDGSIEEGLQLISSVKPLSTTFRQIELFSV